MCTASLTSDTGKPSSTSPGRPVSWDGGQSSATFSPMTSWPSKVKPAASAPTDRKSTRLNSSHVSISYAVFCLKKKILLNNTNWAVKHIDKRNIKTTSESI